VKNLVLFDKSFSVKKTEVYHLSMQVDNNSFSYCILDIARKKYLAFKYYNFPEKQSNYTISDTVKGLIKNDKFLSQKYKTVGFLYHTRKATIIPTEFYDQKNLKKYFDFNHILDESEAINSEKFINIEAYNVFALPSYLMTILLNSFPNVKFSHHSTPYIESFIRQHQKTPLAIGVHKHANSLDLVVSEGKKLKLFNSFAYRTDNDFIYYILYALNHLGIDNQSVTLHLSGEIDLKSPLILELNTYVKELRLNQHTPYALTFKEVPAHTIINLLNLY